MADHAETIREALTTCVTRFTERAQALAALDTLVAQLAERDREVARAVADEREGCAQVAIEHGRRASQDGRPTALAANIAAAIRERGGYVLFSRRYRETFEPPEAPEPIARLVQAGFLMTQHLREDPTARDVVEGWEDAVAGWRGVEGSRKPGANSAQEGMCECGHGEYRHNFCAQCSCDGYRPTPPTEGGP